MSGTTQVLLAIIYSAAVYGLLAIPPGEALTTGRFPSALLACRANVLSDPDVALRLGILSLFAAVLGWVVARVLTSRPGAWALRKIGARSIYGRVWDEIFRRAPRQWVRLKN